MKENSSFSTKLLVVLLFISIVVILVLGYFLFKSNNNTETTIESQKLQNEIDLLKAQLNNYQTEQENKEANKDNSDNNSNITNNENTDDKQNITSNDYSVYSNKLISERNSISGQIWCLDFANLENLSIEAFIEKDGTGYLSLSGNLASKYGTKYKVVEDALVCSTVYYNQGGVVYFVFIHEDGTVTKTTITSEEIKIEKSSTLKNIVNVVSSQYEFSENYDTTKPICIDINGNKFDLSM